MDKLHIALHIAATNSNINATINGLETTFEYEGGWFFNDSWTGNIRYLVDFHTIEELEDGTGYLLYHEDEDMPYELRFTKQLSVDELIG